MKNSEVVGRFAARKSNRNGAISWNGSNMNCRGEVFYSYGRPRSKFLGEHEKYGEIFLNDDGGCGNHMCRIRKSCRGPRVSFRNFGKFGDPLKLTADVLVGWNEQFYGVVWLDEKAKVYYSKKIVSGKIEDSSYCVVLDGKLKVPKVSHFSPSDNGFGKLLEGWISVPEYSLFKFGKNRLFCGGGEVLPVGGAANLSQAIRYVEKNYAETYKILIT